MLLLRFTTTMSSESSIEAVIPLESNPDIFTEFGYKLGLSPLLQFCDIFSLTDPDLIAFLPRPLEGVILLFPITDNYESFKNSEKVLKSASHDVVWMKQVVKNACGLYALLHILLNLPDGYIVRQSPTALFKQDLMEKADPVKLVQSIAKSIYSSFGRQGQTEAPPAGEDVELHFVCFVKRNGLIYELDGRRNGPVLLSDQPTTGDVLSGNIVASRVQQYMDMTTGENAIKFSLMGLAPSIE